MPWDFRGFTKSWEEPKVVDLDTVLESDYL